MMSIEVFDFDRLRKLFVFGVVFSIAARLFNLFGAGCFAPSVCVNITTFGPELLILRPISGWCVFAGIKLLTPERTNSP
ncbi:hypothetical protein [Spirosoma pulveris]